MPFTHSGDFAGEIAFLGDGTKAVFGASGNPMWWGGGVRLVDLETLSIIDWFPIDLADNLTTSPQSNEVFVSTGQTDAFSRKRFGVHVLVLAPDGKLGLDKTFFLGINGFTRTFGRPVNDQIAASSSSPHRCR